MNNVFPFEVQRMGAHLRPEVERQLLHDIMHYGLNPSGLAIDWGHACQEGHCTTVAGAMLESLSGLRVVDPNSSPVAVGWMDFIHGGDPNPLFVFWLFLDVQVVGKSARVKNEPTIPSHIWSRLPNASRDRCAIGEAYDARWAKDPLVLAWKSVRAR